MERAREKYGRQPPGSDLRLIQMISILNQFLLQKAGHYMDCFAAAIDAHLEEEDIVADQLKEYHYFGQALQGLCNRHQMAQLEVEKAESILTAQQQSKNRAHGHDGYLTKLWGKVTGTVETPDDRQARIETLERNVDDAQTQVQTASNQLRFNNSLIAARQLYNSSV